MDESALLAESNLSPKEIADYSILDESLLLGSTPISKKSKRRKLSEVKHDNLDISLDTNLEDKKIIDPSLVHSPKRKKNKTKHHSKDDLIDELSGLKRSPEEACIEKVDKLLTELPSDAEKADSKVVAAASTSITKEKEDEVDIYSDLSDNNFEITNKKSGDKTDANEHEDELDYEGEEEEDSNEDTTNRVTESPMKINVVVGSATLKKSQRMSNKKLILPPYPMPTIINIPPMLPPLPPVLPPPALPLLTAGMKGRIIYLNPKFRTDVIVKNLEHAGVIKGGHVAVHVNRSRTRTRSKSPPSKKHGGGGDDYVPSPISKKIELDNTANTLLITDMSACTTRKRLRSLFSSVGNVKEVHTFPYEHRAVVTFEHARDAVVCRRKFHKTQVDGSFMSVNFAI